jgi:endonuclease/exonuclease/phosphatase family metal-dependent hydrolase
MLPGRAKQANLDGLAKVITEFDLVGLQEADAGSLRSGFRNQTEYLAEAANFPYWSYQSNRKVGQIAASCNGILSRIEPKEVIDYPLPGRIPGRGALWVKFGAELNELVVVIAHLALGPKARADQFHFLAELIGTARDVVLMGDLNCEAHSAELSTLFAHTSLHPPSAVPPTFPSWHPHRAIDHILVSRTIHIDKLWTLSHTASDHLPLAARVRLSLPG